MNSHPPTLKRALGELELTDSPTDLEPVIELAHQLVGDHPKGRIIVLTDGSTKETEASTSDDKSPSDTDVNSESDESAVTTEYRIFCQWGYVITRPKPTSEVLLAADTGDPLLAWWRYGLGMTAAFTSDAKSRYATLFSTGPSGAYHMEMKVKQDGQVLYLQSRGLTFGYNEELRIRPMNETLLRHIPQFS